MAVYHMNTENLAAYLSNTKNEFVLGCNPSKEGKRMKKSDGYTYPIQVVGLKTTKNIVPGVDCFLNKDGSLAVRVYLPEYTYYAETRELAASYGGNGKLSFAFEAVPKNFEYTLPKRDLNSYNDFKEAMGDLIRRISEELKKDINQFHTKEDWRIVGINVDVTFTVYSTNTK